jgi:molybdopterin synthase sulfur carrier subunit
MTVHLLYFAWVRERIGVQSEDFGLSAPLPIAELVERLKDRSPGHGLALADPSRLRFALNQAHVGRDAIVNPGDEVAIFPPVTGG